MKKLLRKLLTPPVEYLNEHYSSKPDKAKVFKALGDLYKGILAGDESVKGRLIETSNHEGRLIIFSDQHKGTRNGSDDFRDNEQVYLAALEHYNNEKFSFINLGDSEELWENNVLQVISKNKTVHKTERKFFDRHACYKVYGNHDNIWHYDPLAPTYLKQMFGIPVSIYAGIVVRLHVDDGRHIDFFATHGHQGDEKSDGNWFSAMAVAYIWAPLQNFLLINPNSPSNSNALKSIHNQMMYDWSALAKNIVLITGHTHQPVFRSHTHLERLYMQLEDALKAEDMTLADTIRAEIPKRMRQFDHVQANFRELKPSYFNTGCCCYSNGNITGIEIAEGFIRLVKWSMKNGMPERFVAEEQRITDLAKEILGD